MKCKHCKLEVHYEGGYLEEEGTGSKQCFANKIKTAGQSFHGHEPAEPEVELGCPHGCTNLQVAKQCPVHVVEKVTQLVADHGPQVDTRRVPFAPCEGLKDCVTKVECLTAVRCLKNLPEATTQATEARPEIHTVGFKPLMGETKDSSRCSLDGAARIPLNREGTKFGACTLVNGEDGKGGCKYPLHDYELEQKGEAAAQKVDQPDVEPQKPTRNSTTLKSFIGYCATHPHERFWQALRNWSKYHFIIAADADTFLSPKNQMDTFSWEDRSHDGR